MDGEGVRAGPRLRIPERELRWAFSRSSGPGGQGVNTTDSRVELSWDLRASTSLTATQRERLSDRLANRLQAGRLVVVASEHRSQLRNRDAARRRMGALIADALRPTSRRLVTAPSRAARRRRTDDKARRGRVKALRRPPTD